MARLIGRLPDGRLVVQFEPPGVEIVDAKVWSVCDRCGEVWAGNVHRCSDVSAREERLRQPVVSVRRRT